MDPPDGRSQPPPEARGEADLAPTTEFRAFLAGDPVPTGAGAGADAGTPDQPGSDGSLAPPPAPGPSPARRAGGPACGPCSRAGPAAERPAPPRHPGRVAGLAGRASRRPERDLAGVL